MFSYIHDKNEPFAVFTSSQVQSFMWNYSTLLNLWDEQNPQAVSGPWSNAVLF